MSDETATPSSDTPGSETPNGRVVWHDLMSTDPASSQAFYEQLFGWSFNDVSIEGFGSYQMIRIGGEEAGTDIGGIVPLEYEGVPSHWIGYVQVDDVDAVSAAAGEHGGQTCVPPTDIPDIGRFSVVTDPSGAVISPFKSASGSIPDPEAPVTGAFCWDELLTRDPEACAEFYTNIFPWKRETMPMPEGDYHLFKRTNATDATGMMQMPADAEAPSHWLPYVLVEDVDAKAAAAASLGAQTFVEPRDIPNVGRFSVHCDPNGAAFALFKHAGPAA